MRSFLPLLTILALALAIPVGRAAPLPQPDGHGCSARARPGDDLQAALDALPDDGQPATLCLAAGDYPLDHLLHIGRDRTTVRGAGPTTVLRLRDGLAQPVMVIGDYRQPQPQQPIRVVAVLDLQLVGARSEHEFMPEYPYLSNSAVVIRAGEHIRLAGLVAHDCRSACLLSERGSQDLLIEHNEVHHAAWDGISFNSTRRVRLLGNDIHDNAAAGLTTEELDDSEIRGNRLAGNGSQGLYLANARHNRFVDNRFIDNRRAGVLLACSIRYRSPEVLCWDDSMSQDNLFEHNRFRGNPYTFTLGVDRAANCKGAGFRANRWHDNPADATGFQPPVAQYGRCVQTD